MQFVNVQLYRQPRGLELLYVVEGDPKLLMMPEPKDPCRAEGLWQTTCFELFVRDAGQAYREFNFSPSGQWAAYAFQGYRAGREVIALDAPPRISTCSEPWGISVSVTIEVAPEPGARIGLSAVIEETDGTKSYWALAHPPGDKPDFHDPACFAADLPAASDA